MDTEIHIQAIAFDLDGTLVDSAPDINLAINAALRAEGLRSFDLATVRSWIGDGPDPLIERALAAQGLDGREDSALHGRLRRGFDQATLAAPLADGTVFPGIMDLIVGLHRWLPMVVVTNKPTTLARAVLDAAGILPFVSGVFGADSAAWRKPSAHLLLAAARSLSLAPEHMLMVGDGPADLLAAEAADCPSALVAWGYGADAVPPHLRPRRIDSPLALLSHLQRGREHTLHH